MFLKSYSIWLLLLNMIYHSKIERVGTNLYTCDKLILQVASWQWSIVLKILLYRAVHCSTIVKILATSAQGETTNWIIFQAMILSLLPTLLYQGIIFHVPGDSCECFSWYLLCHRLILHLRMKVFQGFWRTCEHDVSIKDRLICHKTA